ncbi:MAG TPA: hypothetical protein VG826_29530 [Pirellulales bacterium]|nr:hypothetical protein [Pirellulales bacterium]
MIVDLGEIIAYLGKGSTLTTQEKGLANLLWGPVEQSIKDLLRSDVEQATYTHLLPGGNVHPTRSNTLDYFDLTGGPLTRSWGGGEGNKLQLMELPVRSVASVYEDRQSYGGQRAGAFGAKTLLTAGVHYYIDWETPGLSKTGHLVRIVSQWPAMPRTVQVTYTAGYNRAELDGNKNDPAFQVDASPIKLAVLETMAASFNASLDLQTGASGPTKSNETGDSTDEYDETESGIKVVIPGAARIRLQKYVNYARLMQ